MPDSEPVVGPSLDAGQIGTSGRPGRGAGRSHPSAASRGLAGATSRRRTTPVATAPAATAETPPSSARPADTRTADTRTADTRTADTPLPETPPSGNRASGTPKSRARPPVTTGERHPLAEVGPAEWLAAFRGAAKEVFGEEWERRLAALLAMWRRRLEGDYVVDEYGFDAEVTEQFFMAALRPLYQRWFRVDVRGIDNIPTVGGALVVSNHSGTVPIDTLMTMVAVHDNTGRFLRSLGADLVFRLPLVGGLARKTGATLACQEDAERMLSGGELVGVWPEGFKGIGKPFRDRYKLQRFGRGGFVSAALRTGVPIVPLGVVGAEEIYPIVGNVPALARLLGVPYVPITPLFPWLGPLGLVPLPSKWLMEFGEPIRTDSYDALAAEDPMLIFDVTDQVRETIQQTLYELLRDRSGVFG